jgi:flavin-dependent dehydrogenase
MRKKRNTEYDVIIVGSGPAGISTAIHLTKLLPYIRNRMIVLEKETHPRKKVCGGGIGAYADYWLHRLGVKMTIASLTLKRIRIAFNHEGYVEYRLDSGGLRTVIREEFDKMLVDAAMSLGDVVVQNEPLISFAYSNEAVVVKTSQQSLTTRVLVGADGAQSIIQKKMYRNLGQRLTRNTCTTLRFMKRIDDHNHQEQRALEAVIDFSHTFRHGIRGYTWLFPVAMQGQTWLNTGVSNFHSPQSQGRLLKNILAEFLSEWDVSLDQSGIERCPIRWFHPSSIFSANRVLLVGDAAGVDPLCGEGISFSLGYGHVAANAIVRALKSNDFSFTTYKDQLLEHEVGRELMNRLQWADKLYRPHNMADIKDILLSLMFP